MLMLATQIGALWTPHRVLRAESPTNPAVKNYRLSYNGAISQYACGSAHSVAGVEFRLQMIGKVLSHFLILKKFRADGVVETYLAQDTALGRLVILKIFATENHKTIGVRKQFINDSSTIADLDHSRICQIYEVGKIDGRDFVAVEFVDGDTLKERLMETPMPMADVLRIGRDVAEALAAAHEKGIIHQNLRPSNIILTHEGRAKVTDFGLAREVIPAARIKNQKDTVRALSRSGVTAGNLVFYMSPEQLRGEVADARSDIFAFGVILYEMAAKVHPFKKQMGEQTVRSILDPAPQLLSEYCPHISSDFQRLVERMLAKDPRDRCQSAREAQSILSSLQDNSIRPVEREHSPIKRRHWVTVAALAILVASTWAFLRFYPLLNASSTPPSPIVPPMTCPVIEDVLSLSPDGSRVAFRWNGDNQGNWDIYIKELDGAGFDRVTTDTSEDCCPAWSPDGRQIAFLRHLGNLWSLYVITLSDGSERRLIGINGPSRLSWSPDGKRIAVTDRGAPNEAWSLWSVSVDNSERSRLTDPSGDSLGDDYPVYSPDGRHLAFIRCDAAGHRVLHVLQVSGGELTPLTDVHSPITLCWTGDSREILYSTAPDTGEMSLWRLPIDGKEPRRVQTPGNHVWGPCMSRERLVFLNSSGEHDIWRLELSENETLKSTEKPVLASNFDPLNPSLSPDGRKIVFVSASSSSSEIWVCESNGTMPLRLTDLRAGSTGNPRWSPDGKWIAFDSSKAGSKDIYVIGAEGWPVRQLTNDSSEEALPRWSRDGRWIYFGSNRSGDWEIWKMPFAGGSASQMTKGGGLAALESSDGRYLYYQAHYLQKRGVWRMPVMGGTESLVLDGVESHLLWDLTDRGIFFINRAAKPRATLSFYDFTTQRVRDWSMDRDHPELESASGLSVSPDGKWVLYSGAVPGFEIMSVDNFR